MSEVVSSASTPADLAPFYRDVSDLIPARIESVSLSQHPVTCADRLIVSLRLLDARFLGARLKIRTFGHRFELENPVTPAP